MNRDSNGLLDNIIVGLLAESCLLSLILIGYMAVNETRLLMSP